MAVDFLAEIKARLQESDLPKADQAMYLEMLAPAPAYFHAYFYDEFSHDPHMLAELVPIFRLKQAQATRQLSLEEAVRQESEWLTKLLQ